MGNHTGPERHGFSQSESASQPCSGPFVLPVPSTITADLSGEELRRINVVQLLFAAKAATEASRAYEELAAIVKNHTGPEKSSGGQNDQSNHGSQSIR